MSTGENKDYRTAQVFFFTNTAQVGVCLCGPVCNLFFLEDQCVLIYVKFNQIELKKDNKSLFSEAGSFFSPINVYCKRILH
jgi:hypothetical protein